MIEPIAQIASMFNYVDYNSLTKLERQILKIAVDACGWKYEVTDGEVYIEYDPDNT